MSSIFNSTPSTSAERAAAAIAPVSENAGQRRQVLFIEDMFDPDLHPPEDQTKYVVPGEGWLVVDMKNNQLLKVDYVDYQGKTLKATLSAWNPRTNDGDTAEQDWIYGLPGGPMAGEAVLAIDYSVRPNRAQCDSTIMRPGAAYARVFLGSTAEKSNNISAQYDKSMIMISDKVPVKLAEIVDRTNKMIMTTGPFSVTKNDQEMPDGTRCWLVFYDEGDGFIPPAQPLMVQHSSYMRDHQLGVKYVTAVELLSPWFTDTTNPQLLNLPVNLLLGSVEFRAVKHYSDGSTSEPEAVNGTNFALHGLGEYRPSWPGQTAELTLVGKFAKDEQAYLPQPGNPDFMAVTYNILVGAVEGAYSPRLYTFPVWSPTIKGYRLQHWLYDLDRQIATDVSQFVTFNQSSEPWRPTAYGISQSLIFNLNLRDVSKQYESVVFKQHVGITLYADVNGPGKRFDVSFAEDKPAYQGKFVKVKNAGVATTFSVDNGFATQEEWLTGMYRSVLPSYNRLEEDKAPNPTHFDLVHEDGRKWRHPIADWNKQNVISIEFGKGRGWFIHWLLRSSSGSELQLATTGVTVELV